MKKYFWSWFDGDDNYTNESDGLESILQDVLEYYLSEDIDISILNADGCFKISIVTENETLSYVLSDDPASVAEFLEQQAALEGRPDRFSILVSNN